METYSEIVSNELQDLLEKNYDAEKGYKIAVDNVEHTGLKNFFERKSKQRYNFGHQLKVEIKQFGESPVVGTSVKADLHRVWMNLKSSVYSNNEEAILEEAIRGENATVEAYNKVLEDTSLPSSTKALLEKQKAEITSDLNTVKRLDQLQ